MNYFEALKKVTMERDDDYRAYYTDQELEETPAQRLVRLKAEREAPVVPKGTCKKCGEHIGRGLWRHEQACEGSK